tara:strand:- start:452 stop:577 length:126 start_codon:yes stop_codon:yes gene_type:complete
MTVPIMIKTDDDNLFRTDNVAVPNGRFSAKMAREEFFAFTL